MKPVQALALVGEDTLCCELGAKLVAKVLPTWHVAPPPIAVGGVTKLVKEIPRYANSARRGSPLVCIADTDRRCPVEWLDKALKGVQLHDRFMLRLAVPEAEGWVLADHDGMLQHFRTPLRKLPAAPDSLADPKHEFMKLVSSYAPAAVRRDMIFRAKSGELRRATGYNTGLREFALQAWSPERAAQRSPSLMRALVRLKAWQSKMAGELQ